MVGPFITSQTEKKDPLVGEWIYLQTKAHQYSGILLSHKNNKLRLPKTS